MATVVGHVNILICTCSQIAPAILPPQFVKLHIHPEYSSPMVRNLKVIMYCCKAIIDLNTGSKDQHSELLLNPTGALAPILMYDFAFLIPRREFHGPFQCNYRNLLRRV